MYKLALVIGLCASTAAFAAKPVQQEKPVETPKVAPACATSDLTVTGGASVLSCAGFYFGNLSSASTKSEQVDALALLGYAYNGTPITKLEKLEGTTTINFNTALTGGTYVGVHYGAGNGSPGAAIKENLTAFYLINAGTGINSFLLNFKASSNATLYATGLKLPGDIGGGGGTPGVPEPAAWALMMFGFGAVGVAHRRRNRSRMVFA